MVKILVVDDDSFMTMAFPLFLKNIGEILCAGNGKEALEILEKNKDISIVITDCNMPIMDGFELAGHIKSEFPDVKLIIMSAMDRREDAGKAGADEFVYKCDSQFGEKMIKLVESLCSNPAI